MSLGGFARTEQRPDRPAAMERHAAEQLRFIRDTMERAGVFTAVPGWAGVLIGLTALIAGAVASGRTPEKQFQIWTSEAFVSVLIGVAGVWWKAKRARVPLASRPGKRALVSFITPLSAGAVLSFRLYGLHDIALMPGMWLLLYGAGVIAAGAHSVRVVPIMGLSFAVLGAIALLTDDNLANVWMMFGFGGLHIIFGFLIARRYGG